MLIIVIHVNELLSFFVAAVWTYFVWWIVFFREWRLNDYLNKRNLCCNYVGRKHCGYIYQFVLKSCSLMLHRDSSNSQFNGEVFSVSWCYRYTGHPFLVAPTDYFCQVGLCYGFFVSKYFFSSLRRSRNIFRANLWKHYYFLQKQVYFKQK